MVDELRRLPTRAIARLLQAPLARVLDDDEQPGDREALRVGGTVLSERKRRRKAA